MEEQINNIWKNFSAGLKFFISQKVSNEFEAEEILQEVFIKIHNKIDTLRDKEKIGGWIYKITQNAIIDYYRTKKSDVAFTGEESFEQDYEPDAHKEFQKDLLETIMTLPAIYRDALIKTEYNGLSQVQLAADEGISIPAAKSRVQRARKMLRDVLMQCCHIEFDKYGRILDYHQHLCCCCTPKARSY